MSKKKKKHNQPVKLSPKAYLKNRARSLPIYKCWINEEWEDEMMAHIFLVRKHSNGNLTFGTFLVDLVEAGLKDCFAGVNETEAHVMGILKDYRDDFIEIDYNVAHNIVYGGLEFAVEQGRRVCREFEWAQYVLEEDTDDIPLINLPFGLEGDSVENVENEDLIDEKGLSFLLTMIDMIYTFKLGDEWMDPDFSEKRIDADEEVEYKIDHNVEYAMTALGLIEPFLQELDEISEDDPSYEENCQNLIEKVNKSIAENLTVSQLHDLLANIYFGMDNNEKCYQTLRNQIEIFPDNYMSKLMAGIRLLDLGKSEDIEALLNEALDVRDLKVGPKGLTEFEVCAFYTLRCKYFMVKRDYEKAEIYYQFVREMQLDNSNSITILHMDVLVQYSNFKKERLEKLLGKTFEEILEEEEVKKYLDDIL